MSWRSELSKGNYQLTIMRRASYLKRPPEGKFHADSGSAERDEKKSWKVGLTSTYRVSAVLKMNVFVKN